MGGRALKNTTTRRYERAEFEEISKELVDILSEYFTRVTMPLFYKNKKTFGDADILVTATPELNMRDYIERTFHPNEIFHNGDCWSFDYKELQVDIITCEPEHFDSNAMYLSYNDLGNFIGRLAHGFGLRYGQEGLWYEHKFKGRNIGSIPISKNYPKIFEFLGLSYERYEQGFNELEDIFVFISESPYFNWKRFQLEELNKINRDRNKKRASYISFLEWIDNNVADYEHEYEFYEDKSRYVLMIEEFFPKSNLIMEIRRLEFLECRDLYVKAKFNGSEIIRRYGLQGKELGDNMSGFKDFISVNYGSYNDYIIYTDMNVIYNDFGEYLKNIAYEHK